ncbi:MAG TPA: hypothetical protein VG738_23635 [Chitinophagaceae bacterium]|nr:hypothetical protein [Chitinophagaceae bacterium]
MNNSKKCLPAPAIRAGEVVKTSMRLSYKLLALVLFAGLSFNNVFCQQVSAFLDRDKVVIGEQVVLTLKAADVDARTSFLTNWFTFPDSVGHLSIIKKDLPDTVDVDGLTTYIQRLTITSFDSGRWAIPLQPIIIQDRTTGKKTTLKPDSVFLQVLPVDVSGLKDYHDIKDILDVPKQTDYTLLVAAGISIVIITVLIILLVRRKGKPAASPKPVKSTRQPLEEALFKISELDEEALPGKGQIKLFFIKLDVICREYCAARMPVDAMHLTSDELLPILNIYLTDKTVKERYLQLLQLIDSAKFAKYKPGNEQADEALKLAALVLKYIDSQIQLAKKHVN